MTSDSLSQRVASCYLAGPIDGLDDAEKQSWSKVRRYEADRHTLLTMLVEAGFAVYAPHRAWAGADQSTKPHRAVTASNAAALDHCDVLVAMLPVGVPTAGTYEEIAKAVFCGTPVVVVGAGYKEISAIADTTGVVFAPDLGTTMQVVENWRRAGVPPTELPDLTEERDRLDEEIAAADRRVALPFTMNDARTQYVPVRHYRDDAAIDLYVTANRTIKDRDFVDVPAGCRVELPDDTFGMIVGRSSAVRKRGILVVTGIIDVGYRGDLFVGCYNISGYAQTLHEGDRIGQLLILPNLTQHYVPTVVDELSDSQRGHAGFGSTGGYAADAVERR